MRPSGSAISSHPWHSSAFGSVATMWSDSGAKCSIDSRPDTAVAMGTRTSGQSNSFAESTRKWLPE